MSISSISNNGHFYSRPIKRRPALQHVQEENIQARKQKTDQNKTGGFEFDFSRDQTKLNNSENNEEQTSGGAIAAFISHLEKLPVSSDRASNTYHQVDNFEKQQEVRRMFGIDLYA